MTPKPLGILWKVVKKLLVFAVSAVVLVLAGELVARAAEPGQFSLLDQNPYQKGFKGLRQFHKRSFEGRWDGTWYGTNSIGLRGPEIELEKDEDEFRIVALGDSCTFGKSVVEEDTWPRQLETKLQQEFGDDRRAVVANCGVNGYAGKDYIKPGPEQHDLHWCCFPDCYSGDFAHANSRGQALMAEAWFKLLKRELAAP